MSPTRRIDASRWAKVLGQMLKDAGVNQSELARQMGVDRKSVQRWLKRETSVTADNVRDAATILGYDVQQTLAAVGFLGGDRPTQFIADDPVLEIVGELRSDWERDVYASSLEDWRKVEMIEEARHRDHMDQLRDAWHRRHA